MDNIGPLLETLTRRLAETPVAFLDAPLQSGHVCIRTLALVHDTLWTFGFKASLDDLSVFETSAPEQAGNWLTVVQIACWLLRDSWFEQADLNGRTLLTFLAHDTAPLAQGATAADFVHDDDHREEMARWTLARLGYRPAGETATQASDRLTRVSSMQRRKLIDASRAAEARARAVREALARKAAAESADKWSRE